MPRTQQSMTLALEPATVRAMYASPVERQPREKRIPLSPEILDLLPTPARRVIRQTLARGGVEAFLERADDHAVTIIIRNKRRS